MNRTPFQATHQLAFLTELVNSHTDVAGDILQVGEATWAIHASIPVDGDVLVAEYDSFESAKAALAQLPPNWVTDGQTSITSRTPVDAPAYFLGRDAATWRTALARRPALAGVRP